MRTPQELKARRKKAGWTQRQLAEKAGVHCQTVKYWEGHDRFVAGWAVDRFNRAFIAANIPDPIPARFLLPKHPPTRRPLCGAMNRKGTPCKARALPGKRRCKFHGGMSTGPKTPEGRARIAEAQRNRWQNGGTINNGKKQDGG